MPNAEKDALIEALLMAHVGCALSEGMSWEPEWAKPLIDAYIQETGGWDAAVGRYLGGPDA